MLFKNWICENLNEIVSALLSIYCKNIILLNSNLIARVLWENPNPSSNFSAQTITLSSEDYDYIEVETTNSVKQNYVITKIYPERAGRGTSFYVQPSTNTDWGNIAYFRHFIFESKISINFLDCYIGYIGVYQVNNSQMIPQRIIGYKETIG